MYDVIIVGGGVAGCRLAALLGEATDLSILLLEKNKNIYLKDSGIVSSHITDFLPDRKLIEHDISEMVARSPGGHEITLRSFRPFAHILKRVAFSKFLREAAEKRVDTAYETVISIQKHQTFFIVSTTRGEYRCRFLIGADGAYSLVRRSLGIAPPHLYHGILVRTRQRLGSGPITVHFHKHYSPDFFSWIIPQTNEYGIVTSYRPRDYFLHFRKTFSLPPGDIHAYLLPLGTTRSYADRSMLVGDACGQSKPLTGGGIIFSLRAAGYAAEVIGRAFDEQRFDRSFLSLYEFLWKRRMGREISQQLLARRLYRRMTNRDIDRLFLELGPYVTRIEEFDYDHLSQLVSKMPKWHLFKYLVKNMSLVFSAGHYV